MGQEYQRSSRIEVLQSSPKIVWHDNFDDYVNVHPFTNTGGTAANRSYASHKASGYWVTGERSFRLGSAPTAGGTVWADFHHGLRNPLGRYRVKVRVRTYEVTDDVDFEYIEFRMDTEYHTGVNPRTTYARVRYYSNYGNDEVIQIYRPGGLWETIGEFTWPTFDNRVWRELQFTFDAVNEEWVNIQSNDQIVDLRSAGYSVLMDGALAGVGVDYTFRIEVNFANTAGNEYIYLDEVLIEEL